MAIDPLEERDGTIQKIALRLSEMRAAGRPPSRWEKALVGTAINGLIAGWYYVARGSIDLSRAPREEINPLAWDGPDPDVDKIDLDMLDRAFESAKSMPHGKAWL